MISASAEWKELQRLASELQSVHLSDLLADRARNEALIKRLGSHVTLDLSREKLTEPVLQEFYKLFDSIHLNDKIAAMFSGEKINKTENRSVLHTALRGGQNVEVLQVLKKIEKFSKDVRSGLLAGFSGKPLTNVVCIGIGGSYLGPEFVFEALRSGNAAHFGYGRTMRFLANVDPVDVFRALEGLDPESTLVVVISKTFTTAETMLNAETVKSWILAHYNESGREKEIIGSHFCAVSTAIEKTETFGISNVFGFWDWVGGRFSVCSAVGLVPLSLHFGYSVCEEFLNGARAVDEHFKIEKNYSENVCVLLGLVSVWNSSFLGIKANAILPYAQALVRFVAHIQQLDMESNGKRVTMEGETVDFATGQIIFGEPGTNGQHSFYQLLHQGVEKVSCDFIGFKKSTNAALSRNHDELMSNFFAQPDALALGKTAADGHRHFPGDRPSLSILMPVCDAFHVGALLALYEHRTAVQSFVWNTNAFDQWGVELGKVLAKDVAGVIASKRGARIEDPHSQKLLLQEFLLP